MQIHSASSQANQMISQIASRPAAQRANSSSPASDSLAAALSTASSSSTNATSSPSATTSCGNTGTTDLQANASTVDLARRGPPPGPPPGGDPIASLDSDDDGSVSADEFGLDGATEEVQNLFSAIDADGSGALSTDEIDGFREAFMAAEQAGGSSRMGPPPGPPPQDMGAADRSSDDTTLISTRAGEPDVSAFLQQLAARYAELMGSSDTSTSHLNALA